MKKRMLSVLLSAMLVIVTICVSNMPSRAVELEDEVTQDETVTTEVLSNSEVLEEEVTEELSEEVTETIEEVTEEMAETDVSENSDMTVTEEAAESIISTETIADEEKTDTAVNDADDDKIEQGNKDGITKTDDMDVEADIVRDIEDDEMSEESTEEVKEEITEEMLEGAEVEKLENVKIQFRMNPDGNEDTCKIQIVNNNEFDVYVSCLKGYATDDKGNKYNVPISVKYDGWYGISEESDITNDVNGYWGYSNEGVLMDENILIHPENTNIYTEWHKNYSVSYTVPVEIKDNFVFHMYVEIVRLDDTSGKVLELYSDSEIWFEHNQLTNIENSDYCILENIMGTLDIDINVYHEGNTLIPNTEATFYIEIYNKNDFTIELVRIQSQWARDKYDSVDELRNGMSIIDSNGINITNCIEDDMAGFDFLPELWMEPAVIDIKAGEMVTFKVNCTLSADDSGKTQPIDFQIELTDELHARLKAYVYDCVFKPLNDDTPTVSIDKKDENVPDIKLDDKACDNLINSIFTKNEINSGKHLKVDLIVAVVAEASVEQSDLAIIKVAAKKRKIAVILDMNLVKMIDGILSGNVNELDKEITMTIDVPKEFQADNRKFSIIRLHDGIAEELPDLDDNPNTVTFTTGKFSLYALIYEDAAITPVKDTDKTQQTASPNTGDSIPVATLPIVMLTTIVLAVLCIRKMKKDNM